MKRERDTHRAQYRVIERYKNERETDEERVTQPYRANAALNK